MAQLFGQARLMIGTLKKLYLLVQSFCSVQLAEFVRARRIDPKFYGLPQPPECKVLGLGLCSSHRRCTVLYTILECTTLHYITMQCITPNYSALNHIAPNYTALYYNALKYITLHCTMLNYSAINYFTFNYSALRVYTILH